MRIAHLSDIHVSHVPSTLLSMWWGKRLLGGTNMILNRRRHMPNALVPVVVQHVLSQPVDAVLLSGDFSTTAQEKEFALARTWLEPLSQIGPVVAIPGNHDMYTRSAQRNRSYEQYFSSWHGQSQEPEGYPFVYDLGDRVVCIGLNSSVPTDWFGSWGMLTEQQLQRLPDLLQEYADHFRILMIHHFLQDKHGQPGLPTRGLRNRDLLLEILRIHGAELIVHGHEHACYQYTVPGREKNIPVLNSGPTTFLSSNPKKQAGYQVIDIENHALRSVTRYGLQPDQTWQSWEIPLPV